MWPRRALCDLLGIEHPILQAPMRGTSTVALAAAVSNAGGLGALAFGGGDPDEIAAEAARLRTATNRPANLNFFVHAAPRPDPERDAAARARLAPFYEEFGLGPPPAPAHDQPGGFGEAALSALLAARPAVASFHFGLPAAPALSALRAAGIRILASATTLDEARALDAAGVDAVIAQGWEAGGHRGAHGWSSPDAGTGTLALVPQIADAVSVPVIAAGGIADGRGIAAAFALGAAGVQIGTAFAACRESASTPAWRAAMRSAETGDTTLTDMVSGNPARARRTRYVQATRGGPRAPDFPAMYALHGPLCDAARAAGSEDFEFLLYGQAAPLAREVGAAELMAALIAEAEAAMAGLAPAR